MELTPQALDLLDDVITAWALTIADTGTIMLSAGQHEGRRILSLVPDLPSASSTAIRWSAPSPRRLLESRRQRTRNADPGSSSQANRHV